MQRNIVFVTRSFDAEGIPTVRDVIQPGANDRHNFRMVYGIARERAIDVQLEVPGERVEVAIEAHLYH